MYIQHIWILSVCEKHNISMSVLSCTCVFWFSSCWRLLCVEKASCSSWSLAASNSWIFCSRSLIWSLSSAICCNATSLSLVWAESYKGRKSIHYPYIHHIQYQCCWSVLYWSYNRQENVSWFQSTLCTHSPYADKTVTMSLKIHGRSKNTHHLLWYMCICMYVCTILLQFVMQWLWWNCWSGSGGLRWRNIS